MILTCLDANYVVLLECTGSKNFERSQSVSGVCKYSLLSAFY